MSEVDNLSFPDPIVGNIKRASGEGCLTCVHKKYCRPFYWQRLYEIHPKIDPNLGTSCTSWSNNPQDQIRTPSAGDLAANERMNDELVLREPFPNGIVEPTTGSANTQ